MTMIYLHPIKTNHMQATFDWGFVNSIDPQNLAQTKDVHLMKSISRIFLNATILDSDSIYDYVHLFQLLQVIMGYLLFIQSKLKDKVKELEDENKKLRSHIRKHCNPIYTGATCPICMKVFKDLPYLDAHIFKNHPQFVYNWQQVRTPRPSFPVSFASAAIDPKQYSAIQGSDFVDSMAYKLQQHDAAAQIALKSQIDAMLAKRLKVFQNKIQSEIQSLHNSISNLSSPKSKEHDPFNLSDSDDSKPKRKSNLNSVQHPPKPTKEKESNIVQLYSIENSYTTDPLEINKKNKNIGVENKSQSNKNQDQSAKPLQNPKQQTSPSKQQTSPSKQKFIKLTQESSQYSSSSSTGIDNTPQTIKSPPKETPKSHFQLLQPDQDLQATFGYKDPQTSQQNTNSKFVASKDQPQVSNSKNKNQEHSAKNDFTFQFDEDDSNTKPQSKNINTNSKHDSNSETFENKPQIVSNNKQTSKILNPKQIKTRKSKLDYIQIFYKAPPTTTHTNDQKQISSIQPNSQKESTVENSSDQFYTQEKNRKKVIETNQDNTPSNSENIKEMEELIPLSEQDPNNFHGTFDDDYPPSPRIRHSSSLDDEYYSRTHGTYTTTGTNQIYDSDSHMPDSYYPADLNYIPASEEEEDQKELNLPNNIPKINGFYEEESSNHFPPQHPLSADDLLFEGEENQLLMTDF